MKKTLILNIVLVLGFALLLGAFIFVTIISNLWAEVGRGDIIFLPGANYETAVKLDHQMCRLIIPEIFIGIAALTDLAVLAIIDIPLIKAKIKKTK